MKNHRAYIFLVLLFALSSCAPATPTLLPIETVFAATHGAIMSQTAAAKSLETATPQSTHTHAPTITPFPSATTVLLNIVATSTPTTTPIPSPTNITSGSGNILYACELVQLSPENDYIVKPNESFHWVWHVRNIGTTKWYPDTVSVKYARGAQYYIKKEAPLGDTINIGDVALFRIKMQAPKEPGTYTTTFSLKKGIHYFCYFNLRIIVKK